MEAERMNVIATALYAVATQPAMTDVLFPDSIRAEWNGRLQSFSRVSIRGYKKNRFFPNKSERFTLHFYAADDISELAIVRKVSKRVGMLGVSKKKESRSTI